MLAGFGPYASETKRQDELSVAGGQIDFRSESDVAIFRAIVFPGHLKVLGQILPAVGSARESDRALEPWSRTGQRKGAGIALRK